MKTHHSSKWSAELSEIQPLYPGSQTDSVVWIERDRKGLINHKLMQVCASRDSPHFTANRIVLFCWLFLSLFYLNMYFTKETNKSEMRFIVECWCFKCLPHSWCCCDRPIFLFLLRSLLTTINLGFKMLIKLVYGWEDDWLGCSGSSWFTVSTVL